MYERQANFNIILSRFMNKTTYTIQYAGKGRNDNSLLQNWGHISFRYMTFLETSIKR